MLARLLGVTAGAVVGGVLAGVFVLIDPGTASHGPAGPGGEAVIGPVPPPMADPRMVRIEEHCQKGAETLGDLGRAITGAGSLRDEAVVAELDEALVRMTRRSAVPDPDLAETFGEIERSLGDLRQAIHTGVGVRPALDETLELITQLDGQCRDLLRTGASPGPA